MKDLWVATDIYDEVSTQGRFFEPTHLRQMMAYTRSLGASTITWIVDDMWALYDIEPGGMDLLAVAIEAAHAEGLKFHAVYKPDEGGLNNIELPHTAPRPEGAIFREDLRGILPITRPFVAAHPEMCLKRWPGDEDPGGDVVSIRLTKDNDEPIDIKAQDLTIWSSEVNGRFSQYDKPFTIQQESRWEPTYPMGRTCRSVLIKGLSIPADQRYVEVRLCDNALKGQQFRNEYQNIVELINARGQIIPRTIALAAPPRERYVEMLAKPIYQELVRYARHPEVRAFLNDPKAISEHASQMRAYGRNVTPRVHRLDEMRHLSIARGTIQYMSAQLNPIYPEVRKHWLEAVQFCIDRRADAVNIRPGFHGMLQENWAYGYNEPVMEAIGGEVNTSRARKVIGDAYTQFMREARDLCHAHGRQLGIHLMTNYIRHRDESIDNPMEYMDYQWETWVSEIADFATFRGSFGHRPEVVRFVVDRFADACAAAKIPLAYQSHRRYFSRQPALAFDPDRIQCIRQEWSYAMNHPGVQAYELYETAHFMKINEQGELQGNEQFRNLAANLGFASSADKSV